MTLVVESIQAFVMDRPPIVAFFFSLVAITLTIFLVAFYIKDKDLVLDPHAREDWNSLIKYLNSQELCIHMSNSSESSRVIPEIERQAALSTKSLNEICFPVQINKMRSYHSLLSGLANAVKLEGRISLEDWERSCTNHERELERNENVTITLIVQADIDYSKNASCWVYLSGVPYPPLNKSNHCPNLTVPSQVNGRISSYSFNYLPSNRKINDSACNPGELIQLSYMSSPAPDVYLTMEDKLQIYSHLLRIGCVFLGILFLLLMSGVFQGRTLAHTRRHTLLPTKEIS